MEETEKYLEKYIKAVGGEEKALAKLTKLASRSERAKKMLELLTAKTVKVTKKTVQTNHVTAKFYNKMIVQRRKVTHPMETADRMCSMIGVSPNDVEFDGDYNVVIKARWLKGRASYNGKPIIIPKTMMKPNILKEGFTIKFKVMSVSRDGRIIAEPISTAPGRIFDADVFYTPSSVMVLPPESEKDKRVIVPRQFMAQLLTYEGKWQMRALRENDRGIIAKPIKPVNQTVIEEKNERKIEDTAAEQRFQELINSKRIVL